MGQIRPAYVTASEQYLSLAAGLIGIYEGGIGKKRSQLRTEVGDLENGPFDFRLVRGLETILERRSVFAVDSPVDPGRIRSAIFSRSGGFTPDPASRSAILAEVAGEFKLAAEEVERLFWNDLDDEQVLRSFDAMTPTGLLASYNLSLTQTLLFRATTMEFRPGGNWKNIFRMVKYLGLMYSIDTDQDGYLVSVEGPVALLKLTQRYGTNLAKLLPEIIKGGKWILRAQIVSRGQDDLRLLTFVLGSSEKALLPSADRPPFPEREYDSSLESSFARRFNAMESRWKLLREPEPIPVGQSVMIPDFAFELGSRRVFLEIVGFWTREYLERKLAKLQQVHGVDLIVAVDSSLGITKKIPGKVIPFEGEVPLRPILGYLELRESECLKSELEQISRVQLNVSGDCVPLQDLCTKWGFSKGVLLKRLRERPVEGYALVGDCLISSAKIKSLEKVVSEDHTVSSVAPKLEAEGVTDPYPLLKLLGYQVVFKGIHSDSAEYYRPKQPQGEPKSGS
jgi:hypothetical protein